jgi:bacterial/archaeal transporter family-2 protein
VDATKIGLFAVIVLAGILQACGVSMNAQLRTSLQNPWLASIVSFILIVPCFVLAFAISPRPLPTVEGIVSMPWWAPLGGIAGAFAVLLGLVFVSKIGAGTFNGLLITANLMASLLIDHMGWLNMPSRPLTLWRILGGLLMIVGISFISKS